MCAAQSHRGALQDKKELGKIELRTRTEVRLAPEMTERRHVFAIQPSASGSGKMIGQPVRMCSFFPTLASSHIVCKGSRLLH